MGGKSHMRARPQSNASLVSSAMVENPLGQEFRRYFDIGVMHAQNRKLIEDFGSPSGAGKNFVLGELRYLAGVAPWRVPEAILRTLLKYTAYKLGRREEKISLSWKKRLSMHKRYWPAG
jgi:rhamnosyltransferase